MPHSSDPTSLPPDVALARLTQGNLRFRTAVGPSHASPWSQKLATEEQHPFAIVLGCSDSRMPVEIVFDEGFGSLFVVRVAGNIVAPSIVGSIEFAAANFGSRLVVVMGHSRCGAVDATVRTLRGGAGSESRNIRSITERIAPHVAELVQVGGDPEVVLRSAVRANVRASAAHLCHGSGMLEELVESGRLAVACAEYHLDTGVVEFFDYGAAPPR